MNWSYISYPNIYYICCCSSSLLFLFGRPLQKSIRLRHFKSDRGEIWQHCSSSKYTAINAGWVSDVESYLQDGDHDFISHRKVLCCHLVTENKASAARTCSDARLFLTYNTFVLAWPSTVCNRSVAVWVVMNVIILCGTYQFRPMGHFGTSRGPVPFGVRKKIY